MIRRISMPHMMAAEPSCIELAMKAQIKRSVV
jgi:hypothetical protein